MTNADQSAALVSIVLTTFNRAELLKGALSSCLGQSYRNIEVLVVDDASADHTSSVVESVRASDERVRYLRMPTNGGQSRALNAGFAACKGELITWTSDDNRFKSTAIEVMARQLVETPDVSLVFADYEDVTLEGEVIGRRSPMDWKIEGGFVAPGVCFLYRRRVYEVVGGYDTSLRCCPDLDYWIRVQRRFQVRHLPLVLYENGVHSNMVSIASAGLLYAETGRVLARNTRWRDRPRILSRWYDQASSAEMKRGRRGATVAYAWVSALFDPRRAGAAARRTLSVSAPLVRGAYRLIRHAFPGSS